MSVLFTSYLCLHAVQTSLLISPYLYQYLCSKIYYSIPDFWPIYSSVVVDTGLTGIFRLDLTGITVWGEASRGGLQLGFDSVVSLLCHAIYRYYRYRLGLHSLLSIME